MLISHAVALAEARSYLAALADTAASGDAGMEYERVLLQLDELHGGVYPPITVVPTRDREVLFRVAHESVSQLARYGVDSFELGICLCMLVVAWEDEHRTAGPSSGGDSGVGS